MNYFGLSDKGQYRTENQDCFEILAVSGGVLAVVCDGMGGVAGGNMASEMAVTRFVAFARAALEASDGDDPADALRQAADAANRKVFRCAELSEEYAGMGTTLVAATVLKDTLYVANVGDSRLYLISGGIRQVTRDHSLVEEMIRAGGLTREEARVHPDKNVITRAVGVEERIAIDFFDLSVKQGDKILLCTDGLSNMLTDEQICQIVQGESSLQSAGEKLVKAANQNGGRDNITVLLAEMRTDEVEKC